MVLMMVFAFSASAFAVDYSDVDSLAQEVQDSIAKVSALAIFEGDGDNTFRPNDTITRAEFAKVACVAAGLGTSGDALKNTASQFTDVQPGEWWTGWINLAVAQGYMKGDPNGTFRPKDPITMAEVTTVLLRMLGYTDNLPGLWPVDYIAQAGKLDLFDNVDFKSDAPATRAQVAVMLDNNLSQNLVVWSKDKDAFEDKEGNVTLMSDSFRGQTAENIRFESADVDSMVDAYKYTGINKDQLELVYNTNYLPKDMSVPSKVADDYAISGGLTLADLAGQEADIIFDKKSDGSTNEVKYIDVTSRVVTTDSVKEASVKTADGDVTGGTVRISNVKYNIAAGAKLTGNAIANETNTRFVIDEDDNVIEALKVADYLKTRAQLVDKYNESAKRIELKGESSIKLSGLNYVFYKDGKTAEITDLEENDTIYAFKDSCGLDYVIYASSPVTGKVTAAEVGDPDKVVIDGTKYSVAPGGFVYSTDDDDFMKAGVKSTVIKDDMFGETAQYALDRAGKVSVLVFNAEEKVANYAVVTSVNTSSKGRVTSLTVFNAEGKYVSYDVDNSDGTVAIYGPTGDKAIEEGNLVKLTINSDGMVDKIEKGKSVSGTNEIDKDTKRISLAIDGKTASWYRIPSTIAAYDITFEEDEYVDKLIDKVETIAYNDVLSKNDFKGDNVTVFVSDGQVKAIAAVGYEGSTSSKFGVVKNNAYYTGSDRLVLFYGFGSDDFSYKDDDDPDSDQTFAGQVANKQLVTYKTSGGSLSAIATIFAPGNFNATGGPANATVSLDALKNVVKYYSSNAEADAGELTGPQASYEKTTIDDKGNEDPSDDETVVTAISGIGSDILSVRDDQIEVKTGKNTSEYLTIDEDTVIYDYSSYTDSLESNNPAKLTAEDLNTGMQAVVITSNDDSKTGYEGIAMLIIIVND